MSTVRVDRLVTEHIAYPSYGKGWVTIMKKMVYILLSVITLALAGCNKNDSGKEVETSLVADKAETIEASAAREKTTEQIEDETTNNKEETTIIEEKGAESQSETSAEKQSAHTQESTTSKADEVKVEKVESPTEATTEAPTEPPTQAPTEKPTESQTETPTQAPTTEAPTQPAVVEPSVIAYDPERVVALATAICQEGGMTTLTDNLDNLLADGSITQEEYDEYYPYDGSGYYSVFVETDLSIASTLTGKRLESEEEIADYIAGMMLLETGDLFLIECAGIYDHNGTPLYEFRCYR